MSSAIDHLMNDSPADFNKEIDILLKARIHDALGAKKTEVASTWINDVEEEDLTDEEDNADEDVPAA